MRTRRGGKIRDAASSAARYASHLSQAPGNSRRRRRKRRRRSSELSLDGFVRKSSLDSDAGVEADADADGPPQTDAPDRVPDAPETSNG